MFYWTNNTCTIDWVKFEKPCIFSYFWEDPVYVSLKSCIVHHRSQNPSPELALKLEVWTNHRPGLAMLGSDWSKLASSSQAPGLGFDFCVELCNVLGLHIQGLPKNNWKYRVFQIWPNLAYRRQFLEFFAILNLEVKHFIVLIMKTS